MKNKTGAAVTLAAAKTAGRGALASTGKSLGSTAGGSGRLAGGDAAATRVGLKQRAAALQRDIDDKLTAGACKPPVVRPRPPPVGPTLQPPPPPVPLPRSL
jgi:hypothetical protein